MSKTSKQITAAAYIRMSTDQQADSPARQRADIEALALRGGYEVIIWYEDHGKTGTESKKRFEFQKMLKDATAGKFRALLVSEQSRMSREDVFDQFAHWKILREAGVSIITCQQGELNFNNLGGLITAIVGGFGAHDESRKIADRVAGGKRLSASKGNRQGGALFGYDRVICDAKGVVFRRVHFREKFVKPRDHTAKLEISEDTEAVEAVRYAFAAVLRGDSFADIKRHFHERGILSTRGNLFGVSDALKILTNPAYMGTLVYGAQSGSKKTKFVRIFDAPKIIEGSHPAIIDRDTFEKVHAVVRARNKKRSRSVTGQFPLHGLVYCGVCGRKMYGHKSKRKGGDCIVYTCVPQNRSVEKGVHLCVAEEPLLNAVIDKIQKFVLSAENIERIRQQADLIGDGERLSTLSSEFVNLHSKPGTVGRDSSPEQIRLNQLQVEIERAERNLALAENAEDYSAVSALLRGWRDEKKEIQARIGLALKSRKGQGDTIEAVSDLEASLKDLKNLSRPVLADLLKQVVQRIEISRLSNIPRGKNAPTMDQSVHSGIIEFVPEWYSDPVPLPSLNRPLSENVRVVVEFLAAQDRECSTTEIAAVAPQLCRQSVLNNLVKAETLGLVERKQVSKQEFRWRAVKSA